MTPINHVSFGLLSAGCLLTTSTASVVSLMKVVMPAEKLLGKPPEYVEAYTKTYKSHVRIRRVVGMTFGCLAGSGVVAVILSFFYWSWSWKLKYASGELYPTIHKFKKRGIRDGITTNNQSVKMNGKRIKLP